MDYKYELEEMVSKKNLMNSYKLFFLKTLILNVNRDIKTFSFYDMACWMCAYSFKDVCDFGGRIRPLDKLFDVAVLAIETEDLMQSSEILEVYDAVKNTKNKRLGQAIVSLCYYVPYRLLAYIWPSELKGKTDKQKNHMIAEYSQSEYRCIYEIYKDPCKGNVIEVKDEWANYITINRKKLHLWIDNKIEEFIRRE